MRKTESSIMSDLKLKPMVSQIQEKIAGNGSLIRPRKISICHSVFPQWVNLSDKELENSLLWSITP
jgi:hypothetical protein